MAKKRTSLDSILTTASRPGKPPTLPAPPLPALPAKQGKRPGVKQQTVYLTTAVHEQLRRLAFEERARMHDYLMEGLDRVFQARGLPSTTELLGRSNQDNGE